MQICQDADPPDDDPREEWLDALEDLHFEAVHRGLDDQSSSDDSDDTGSEDEAIPLCKANRSCHAEKNVFEPDRL